MEVSQTHTRQLAVSDYLRVLYRRKWLIAATVFLLVGGSLIYSALKEPVYQATAQLELAPQVSAALLQANNPSIGSAANLVDVPTDIQVLESTSVFSRVRVRLPNAPRVTVTQVGTTNVLSVSVYSTEPRLAAVAANLYVQTYIAAQQAASQASLTRAVTSLQSHISSLQDQIDVLSGQQSGASGIKVQSLQSRIDSLEQFQTTLNEELSQYETATSLLSTGGGQVISKATVPVVAVAPKPLEYAVIALIVGLTVGIGIALIRDRLDLSLRSLEDVEQILGPIPSLGVVPHDSEWPDSKAAKLVSLNQPNAAIAEAYRSIRTSIQFIALDRNVKLLQITSPKSDEGKTTTVSNLAVTMARAGQRVVVVDCDLRHPRLHAFFDRTNDIGFTSILLGQTDLQSALFTLPGVPTLQILTAGPVPPNPSELLSAQSARELLLLLSESADIVVFDSSPVLPITDAVVLARSMDAVVLMASVRRSNKRDVERAISTLRQVDAPLSGFILNNAVADGTYPYYKYTYPQAAIARGMVEPGDPQAPEVPLAHVEGGHGNHRRRA